MKVLLGEIRLETTGDTALVHSFEDVRLAGHELCESIVAGKLMVVVDDVEN